MIAFEVRKSVSETIFSNVQKRGKERDRKNFISGLYVPLSCVVI